MIKRVKYIFLILFQILEAIDDPNFQRLEQPECCPKEYYTLMLKCWQHDANKRPKFADIYTMLPDVSIYLFIYFN